MSSFNFRTGMEAAEEAAARTAFNRTEFLSIEDGKSVDVRFLTDHNQVITVNQHNNIQTRTAPDGYQGKWPQKMSAVCRMDENEGKRVFPQFEDCFLCIQHANATEEKIKGILKPKPRGWGLAVIRKVAYVDGRAVGMEDEMVEVEIDGKKVMQPKVVIVNFSWNNFWSGLSGITDLHKTWLDRDIRIIRKGSDLDTDYNFAAMDPVDFETGSGIEVKERFDLRKPEHRERYSMAPDLGEIVYERATDEFYDRFFDTRHPQPKQEGQQSASSGGGETSKPPSNEPSQADLDAMAARVAGQQAPAPSEGGEMAVPSFGS